MLFPTLIRFLATIALSHSLLKFFPISLGTGENYTIQQGFRKDITSRKRGKLKNFAIKRMLKNNSVKPLLVS